MFLACILRLVLWPGSFQGHPEYFSPVLRSYEISKGMIFALGCVPDAECCATFGKAA
jgi:hypothetical protein